MLYAPWRAAISEIRSRSALTRSKVTAPFFIFLHSRIGRTIPLKLAIRSTFKTHISACSRRIGFARHSPGTSRRTPRRPPAFVPGVDEVYLWWAQIIPWWRLRSLSPYRKRRTRRSRIWRGPTGRLTRSSRIWWSRRRSSSLRTTSKRSLPATGLWRYSWLTGPAGHEFAAKSWGVCGDPVLPGYDPLWCILQILSSGSGGDWDLPQSIFWPVSDDRALFRVLWTTHPSCPARRRIHFTPQRDILISVWKSTALSRKTRMGTTTLRYPRFRDALRRQKLMKS